MTLINLLCHLPNFAGSLFVVALLASALSWTFSGAIVAVWLVSGALVFHRPTERTLARRQLRLRRPTPRERARLEPVWHLVTARAGVAAYTYELWVEDSDDINAVAAAGHIVGVTRFALNRLPDGELAAVLAHELGHHMGGHTWSSQLGYWYALPGRLAWQGLRGVIGFVFMVSRAFGCLGTGVFVVLIGGVALATLGATFGLPLLFLVMPYTLAAVGRQAELRADRHAALLGFAPTLATVVAKSAVAQEPGEDEKRPNSDVKKKNPGMLVSLLETHPDGSERIERLRHYLPSTTATPTVPVTAKGAVQVRSS
ncbi:M48 family metalloprotease [Streptomyces sp. Ag109_G2-15]|uniref:M48 family metalloprotease n=1 Tax=Streptomyces sp. Ag109_G2-15 TaxID=1938850 RepID=UPI00211CC208|nr:M48 family metalloprotease [Streptomyces sp. Ag109_G2-15]